LAVFTKRSLYRIQEKKKKGRKEEKQVKDREKMERKLNQEQSIDAAVNIRIIGDLGVLAPNNFSRLSDQTEFADVHFDDGSLGKNPKIGV